MPRCASMSASVKVRSVSCISTRIARLFLPFGSPCRGRRRTASAMLDVRRLARSSQRVDNVACAAHFRRRQRPCRAARRAGATPAGLGQRRRRSAQRGRARTRSARVGSSKRADQPRMQLADPADGVAVDRHRALRARDAAHGCVRRSVVSDSGAASASRSPLTSKKSTSRAALAPLLGQRRRRTRGRRCAAAGRSDRPSRANTRPTSNMRTRGTLALDVRAQHVEQPGQQRGAHDVEMRGDRIQHARSAARRRRARARVADSTKLNVTISCQSRATSGAGSRARRALRFGRAAACVCTCARGVRRDRVVAVDARDLLDEVFLDREVEAVRRRRHDEVVAVARERQAAAA